MPCAVSTPSREARVLLTAPSPEMAFFAAWAMQKRHGPVAQRIAMAADRDAGEREGA